MLRKYLFTYSDKNTKLVEGEDMLNWLLCLDRLVVGASCIHKNIAKNNGWTDGRK